MNGLYQTVQEMKDMTCTEETCSTIQKEVEMLDSELKAVHVDLNANMQGACTKDICNKKSDKSYVDTAITDIHEIIDELEGNTCTKETCDKKSDKSYVDSAITDIHEILDELEDNTCSKETCNNIYVEVDSLKKNTCRDETCNNIQAEIDNLEMNTCSMETCSNIQRRVENIDNCMENPWDITCKEHFSTSNSIPESIKSFSDCFRYGHMVTKLEI